MGMCVCMQISFTFALSLPICVLFVFQPEHQRLLIEAGALRPLVSLLQKKVCDTNARMVNGAIRRAVDAICNLAHDNKSVQSRLRYDTCSSTVHNFSCCYLKA